jgi:hypothetical protein
VGIFDGSVHQLDGATSWMVNLCDHATGSDYRKTSVNPVMKLYPADLP